MVVGIACAIAVVFFLFLKQRAASSKALVFKGNSSGLTETQIVPVLNSAISSGKTTMWCSSFQIAWNRLKDDVIKAPVKFQDNDAIANELNVAEQSESDIAAKNVFAAAGFGKDGILRKIKDGLSQKFPGKEAPDFKLRPDDILAYAYLEVDVVFPFPYADIREKMEFKSSNGK